MLLLVFSTNTIYAHSVLLDANPEEGEVVVDHLSTISLDFNTKIEKGSSFYIVNESKGKIIPNNINFDESLIEGEFNSGLPGGNYTLYWSVIGADGHQVTGNYTFEIQVTEKEDKDNSEEEEVSNQDSIEEKDINQNVEELTQEEFSDGKNDTDNWLFIILLILILLFVLWFIINIRRKR